MTGTPTIMPIDKIVKSKPRRQKSEKSRSSIAVYPRDGINRCETSTDSERRSNVAVDTHQRSLPNRKYHSCKDLSCSIQRSGRVNTSLSEDDIPVRDIGLGDANISKTSSKFDGEWDEFDAQHDWSSDLGSASNNTDGDSLQEDLNDSTVFAGRRRNYENSKSDFEDVKSTNNNSIDGDEKLTEMSQVVHTDDCVDLAAGYNSNSSWNGENPHELVITPNNVDMLLISARFFNQDDVIAMCKGTLMECTVENALYYKYVAEKHELKDILPRILDFIRAHFLRIKETHSFLDMDAQQLTQLLSDDYLKVNRELDVFYAARAWVDHNKHERLTHVVDVLSCVRFIYITPDDIVRHVEPHRHYFKGPKGRELLLNIYRSHALQSSLPDISEFDPPKRRQYTQQGNFLKTPPPSAKQQTQINHGASNPVPVPSNISHVSVGSRGGTANNYPQKEVHSSCKTDQASPSPSGTSLSQHLRSPANQPPGSLAALKRTCRSAGAIYEEHTHALPAPSMSFPELRNKPSCISNHNSRQLPTENIPTDNVLPNESQSFSCESNFFQSYSRHHSQGRNAPAAGYCKEDDRQADDVVTNRQQAYRGEHTQGQQRMKPRIGYSGQYRQGINGVYEPVDPRQKMPSQQHNRQQRHYRQEEDIRWSTAQYNYKDSQNQLSFNFNAATHGADGQAQTGIQNKYVPYKIDPVHFSNNRSSLPSPPKKTVLLTIGGLNPTRVDREIPTRLVEQYDPETNTWDLVTRLPEALHHHACAMMDGFLYLIGGSVVDAKNPYNMANPTNACYRYDANGNYWTQVAPMRWPRMYHSLAVLEGVLYALGGQTFREDFLETVEYYNADSDSWGHVASLLDGTIGIAAIGYRGLVYAIGGFLEKDTENILLGSVECYDPRTNKWISRHPLPEPRCHANVVEVGGHLYLIGGSTLVKLGSAVFSLASILRYDEPEDRWEMFEKLCMPRHDAGCCAIGNRIFIVGGVCSTLKKAMDDVECLDVVGKYWLEYIEPLGCCTIGLSCVSLELDIDQR